MAKKPCENIELDGVETHNLNGLSVKIPLKKISVVTGVSGSGKSSLVFDTLHAESYRRFVDSLSSYARQYLKALPKPSLDRAANLPPSIAIKQYRQRSNQRSTVATVTELGHLVQTLFTHLARPFCSNCAREVHRDNPAGICRALFANPEISEAATLSLLSPLAAWTTLSRDSLVQHLREQGLDRFYCNGKTMSLDQAGPKLFSGYIVIDRVELDEEERGRIIESLGLALRLGKGCVRVESAGGAWSFSSRLNCNSCSRSFVPASMALFSFNHPLGACDRCHGYGRIQELDWEKIVPDHSSSIASEGIAAINFGSHKKFYAEIIASAQENGVDIGKPFSEYSKPDWEWLHRGDKKAFGGLRAYFDWLASKKYKAHLRIHAARFQRYRECPQCAAKRYSSDTLAYRIADQDISGVLALAIDELSEWIVKLSASLDREQLHKKGGLVDAIDEATSRIRYLRKVGVGYLSLARVTASLSGGEMQRIYMASCLGSTLTETLYCLDEPTAGLHARDSQNLLEVITELRDQGNTVVVVEHDPTIIAGADQVLTVGPGAGHLGGELVAEPLAAPRYPRASSFAANKAMFLVLREACTHNLKAITARFPLDALTVVCGVSGSGKTSLVRHTLYPALCKFFMGEPAASLGPAKILAKLSEVVVLDQSGLGRSSRSNIATYLGIFESIRQRFARQQLAKQLKLSAGAFSFNVPGGRCEDCKGLGLVVEDLSFLGEVAVTCSGCDGRRFKPEVLQVKWRQKSLIEVLDLTVNEAASFFADCPEIVKALQPAAKLGLGYLRLGQSTSSFSGGEAQRLKLLSIIAKARNGSDRSTVLILDEPTTGLADSDVLILWEHLRELTNLGNTVIVVEHHLDMIRNADWVLDLGPGAASSGGQLLYEGPPQGLGSAARSVTAQYI